MREWSVATSFAGLRTPSAQPHENRRRLVDEVEGAGNDVAGRIDDQAGGRAGAEEHALDPLQAADGLDADHGRRHAIHGGRERRLLLSVRSSSAAAGIAAGEQTARPTGRRKASCKGGKHVSPNAATLLDEIASICPTSAMHRSHPGTSWLSLLGVLGVAGRPQRELDQFLAAEHRQLDRVLVVDVFQLRRQGLARLDRGGRPARGSGRPGGRPPSRRASRAARDPRRAASAPARRESARFPATPDRAAAAVSGRLSGSRATNLPARISSTDWRSSPMGMA